MKLTSSQNDFPTIQILRPNRANMRNASERILDPAPDAEQHAACVAHVVFLRHGGRGLGERVFESEELVETQRRVRVDGV